jgi:hypothetical protein
MLAFRRTTRLSDDIERMRNLYKVLGILLLLMTAQQGAVDHELSHFCSAGQVELRVDAGGVADTSCALCPAFAQVVTPAFSHSIHIPQLVRTASQLTPEPQFVRVDTAVPQPRSRGPPALS